MGIVKDIDKGFKKFMAEVSKMQDAYVKVGYPVGMEKHDNSNESITAIALKMEYGDKNNKLFGRKAPIPPRPFFSNAFEKAREKIAQRVRQYADLIFLGRITTERALRLIGAEFKGDIQTEIKSGTYEPLSAYTIAHRRKNTTKPLIDTGQLRQSVQYEVGGLKLKKSKG